LHAVHDEMLTPQQMEPSYLDRCLIVVRPIFITALIVVLLSPFGIAGQGKKSPQVRIVCPMLRPKLALQVRPKYPKEAKDSGVEGRVSLWCIIEPDGTVGEIEVREGKEPFVQAAKTAVMQWKYEPRVLNGVAVQVDTTMDVIFEIPKQKSKKSESNSGHGSRQD